MISAVGSEPTAHTKQLHVLGAAHTKQAATHLNLSGGGGRTIEAMPCVCVRARVCVCVHPMHFIETVQVSHLFAAAPVGLVDVDVAVTPEVVEQRHLTGQQRPVKS